MSGPQCIPSILELGAHNLLSYIVFGSLKPSVRN